MKTLTSFLIVVMSCSFAFMGTQTRAQDAGDDSANVESNQLDETILQLREQLMKLERERNTEAGPASIVGRVTAEPSALNVIRSGNGGFDDSQAIDSVPAQLIQSLPAQLPTVGYSVAQGQQSFQYQQGFQYQPEIPMGTRPANSTWLQQSIPTEVMPIQSVPMAIASPVEPVYVAPAIEYSQPAPIVQQPVVVQQAPAPQVAPTIIVNIYQQPPAAQNNYFPPIMAPIYGPAPIQVSSPKRGCCLFGRR